MVEQAHEFLKDCSETIWAELMQAEWKHKGKVIEIDKAGSAVCSLHVRKGTIEKREPDSSLRLKGESHPFLILEAGVGQSDRSLAKKRREWEQGMKGHLKMICLVKIRQHPTVKDWRAYATLIKVVKYHHEGSSNLLGYQYRGDEILTDIQIYPGSSTATFEIDITDVLPRDSTPDPDMRGKKITIGMRQFWQYGQRAVSAHEEHIAKKGLKSGNSSPRDPNQEEPTTPTSSDGEPEPTDDNESDDDIKVDPDWVRDEPVWGKK
ncbi:MAG: hypothetical protein LQ352_003063 [Teloschistes flavicans]|nr:MAG: hypothetical protein LQ352_003063 [Teloschistes flavicans]